MKKHVLTKNARPADTNLQLKLKWYFLFGHKFCHRDWWEIEENPRVIKTMKVITAVIVRCIYRGSWKEHVHRNYKVALFFFVPKIKRL